MTINLESVIKWQPQIRAFSLDGGDTIVVSTDNEILFDKKNFPLFQYIDGIQSVKEIIGKAIDQRDVSLFLYKAGRFLNDNVYLTLQNSDKTHLVANSVLPEKLSRNIYSNISQKRLVEEPSFISKLTADFSHITIVFTTDIFTISFDSWLKERNVPFICIEAGLSSLKVSPVFRSFNSFISYKKAVFRNKPVAQYLSNKFPGICTRPKFSECNDKVIPDAISVMLHQAISEQVSSSKNLLLQIHLDSCELQAHQVSDDLSSNSKLSTAIKLKSSPAPYNNDGGSRTQQAAETVSRLITYVSPLSGLITHIEPVNQHTPSPVTIYRTAFFKIPSTQISKPLDTDSFVQVCLGKGVTHEQSKASALCEAIERKNAQYIGDEPSHVTQAQQLDARSYDFAQLLPYSEQQYARFSDPADSESQRKQAALPYTEEAVNWTALWSLTLDEKVYVPTVCCFANTPFEEDRFGKWHSNGCAAGNNLEEAILQALFELLERDATAIWWYNRLPRPQFELIGLDPNYLAPLHETITAEHDYWVLDLTVDTGVPVMAAIGRNKTTQGYVFGFGCHLKPEMAAQRALTELCQLIPIRDQNGAPFDFDAITDDSFLLPNEQAPRGSYKLTQSGDLKDDILAIVEHLHSLNMETLVLDYSRSPIPLSTAKVFVPGLCHIWPQLGNSRLYQTPVTLGWLEQALTEQTINQQGLYI